MVPALVPVNGLWVTGPGTSDQWAGETRSDDCCNVNPSPFQKSVDSVPSIHRWSWGRTTAGLFAIRAVPGDLQSPIQLMAAFGLRRFSFRVSSWRRLGSGPSVHASALSVVRSVNLSQTGANTALGLSVTMYRLGSRFDPVYSRRPVSFQLLFRIRFGSGRSGRISPSGLSKSL